MCFCCNTALVYAKPLKIIESLRGVRYAKKGSEPQMVLEMDINHHHTPQNKF